MWTSKRLLDPSYIAANPSLNNESLGFTALTGQVPGAPASPGSDPSQDIKNRFATDVSQVSYKPDPSNGQLSMSPSTMSMNYRNKIPGQNPNVG